MGIGVGFTVLAALGARVVDLERKRLERAHKARVEPAGEHHAGHTDKGPPAN